MTSSVPRRPKNRLFGVIMPAPRNCTVPYLVAVAIEHVGVRHDERDPQVTVAIDGCGADGRRHQRQLAFAVAAAASSSADLRRSRSISRPWIVSLEQQPPGRGRISGTPARRSGTRREAAVRIDERDAAVQREVQVGDRARDRSAGARRRSGCVPPVKLVSAISAPVSGCDIRIEVPVYCSDPMPFSTALSNVTPRLRAARQAGSRRCGIRPA